MKQTFKVGDIIKYKLIINAGMGEWSYGQVVGKDKISNGDAFQWKWIILHDNGVIEDIRSSSYLIQKPTPIEFIQSEI